MSLKLLKGFELRIKDKESGKIEVIASWKPLLPMLVDETEKEIVSNIITEPLTQERQ